MSEGAVQPAVRQSGSPAATNPIANRFREWKAGVAARVAEAKNASSFGDAYKAMSQVGEGIGKAGNGILLGLPTAMLAAYNSSAILALDPTNLVAYLAAIAGGAMIGLSFIRMPVMQVQALLVQEKGQIDLAAGKLARAEEEVQGAMLAAQGGNRSPEVMKLVQPQVIQELGMRKFDVEMAKAGNQGGQNVATLIGKNMTTIGILGGLFAFEGFGAIGKLWGAAKHALGFQGSALPPLAAESWAGWAAAGGVGFLGFLVGSKVGAKLLGALTGTAGVAIRLLAGSSGETPQAAEGVQAAGGEAPEAIQAPAEAAKEPVVVGAQAKE